MSNHMRVSPHAIKYVARMSNRTTMVQVRMSRIHFEELCVQQGWSLHCENSCVGLWGTNDIQMARYNYSYRLATIFSR